MDEEDDRFGVPNDAFTAAGKAHGNAHTMRCGVYVPTRREVRSMSPEELRPLLVDWLWESPSQLIPTSEQVSQVKALLETRPDAAMLVALIEECRLYIES